MNLHCIAEFDLLGLSFSTLACTRRSIGRVGNGVGSIAGAKTMSGRRHSNDRRRSTVRGSSPIKILDPKSWRVLVKTNLEVAGSTLSVSDRVDALRFKGNPSRTKRLPIDTLRALKGRVADFPRSFNVTCLLNEFSWGPRRGPPKSVSSSPATFPSSLEYSDEIASALLSGEEGGTEAKSSRALMMASIMSDLVRVSVLSVRKARSYKRTRSLLRSLFS